MWEAIGEPPSRTSRGAISTALRPPLGPPRPPLPVKAHPLPRARIGARLSAIVELSGDVWLVFVLVWFVCGTVSSAYVDELQRARNAKEKSKLCFVIAENYVIFMSMAE